MDNNSGGLQIGGGLEMENDSGGLQKKSECGGFRPTTTVVGDIGGLRGTTVVGQLRTIVMGIITIVMGGKRVVKFRMTSDGEQQ